MVYTLFSCYDEPGELYIFKSFKEFVAQHSCVREVAAEE